MRKATLDISVLAIAVAIAGYVFFTGERKVPGSISYVDGPPWIDHVDRHGDRVNQSDDDRAGRQPGLRDDRESSRRFQLERESRRGGRLHPSFSDRVKSDQAVPISRMPKQRSMKARRTSVSANVKSIARKSLIGSSSSRSEVESAVTAY